MATIEERAKINATKTIEYACGRRAGEPDYITNLFIKMATEQKAIDIDKAKKAFNAACGWLAVYTWYNGVFEEFVKAMEE